MGLRITTPAPPVSPMRSAAGFIPPVPTGLVGMWLGGGSVDQSCRNLWPDGGYGDGAVVGSPDVSDYHLGFKTGVDYIKLPFGDFANTTVAVISRTLDTLVDEAHQPIVVGTSRLGLVRGGTLYYPNATQARVRTYQSIGGVNTPNNTENTLDVADWKLIIADWGSTEQAIADMTGSPAADRNLEAQPADSTHLTTTSPMCWGGGGPNERAGECDSAMLMVWNRQITAPDREAVLAWARTFYARRGITV